MSEPAALRQVWGSFLGILGWGLRGRATPRVIAPPPPVRPYVWEKSYPPGLGWAFTSDPKPLTALLDEAVARYPDNPCLFFQGKRYRYKDVDLLVRRAARGLQDLGVKKGVNVGLMLPNCPYYIIAFYAVLRAGGTVVNFNPLYAPREIERQIRDSDTRIMITLNLKSMFPKVVTCLGRGPLERIVVCSLGGVLPFLGQAWLALINRKELAAIPRDDRHVRFEDIVNNDGDCLPVPIDVRDDVAVLQFTGGTTGTPKGAMLSHANLYANAVQTCLWGLGTRPGAEVFVAVLPLFHVFGMTVAMNVALMMGAEILLLPRFKLNDVLKLIEQRRPTVFLGVPTMYSAIAEHPELARYDLSSLRYCLSGGAPLSPEIQRAFEAGTGSTLVEGYGLTEAGPVCTVNPLGEGNRVGSVGLPLPGTVVEIADVDDPDRLLGLGEHGEICIRGPQVMIGYRDHPEENATTLRDGRLHTGDVGYIDGDGYVHIVDRIKDLILNGGFNVYPRMVEEAICLHPAVREAAVVGVPDRHRGEIVRAYVTLRPGAAVSGAELRAFLREHLAPFELPRQVVFRDELPRTLIGKVDRKALRDMARRGAADGGAEAAALSAS